MMKVLHIITGLEDGGAEAVLFRLCLHARSDCHVVISMMDEGKYGALLRNAGIEVHCLGMRQGKIDLHKIYTLWRIIRLIKPDVVQTWMYHSDLIGGLAARAAGVKNVFWGIHHTTLDKGKAKRSTIIIAKICAFVSKYIPEKIICCANKSMIVHSAIGYDRSKLLVIRNGYDLSLFRPDQAGGQAVRVELGIDKDEFLIGKVGRFDPYKDHQNLFRALAIVNDANIRFRCLLVGKGLTCDNAILMGMIRGSRLQDRVLLAGQRNDIPAVMSSLDLHVLASSSEGFPNVLAEAMACGTSCITTEVGDALDIVGDSQFACPPQDPIALSKLVRNMYDLATLQPDVWQDHRAACVLRIQQRFSIETMVKSYESCWAGLAR